jgi:hypothetical protein
LVSDFQQHACAPRLIAEISIDRRKLIIGTLPEAVFARMMADNPRPARKA